MSNANYQRSGMDGEWPIRTMSISRGPCRIRTQRTVWTKSADDILDSVRRFCQRTADVSKRQKTSNSDH